MKRILLSLLIVTSILCGEKITLKKVELACGKGGANQMAECYYKEFIVIDNEMENKIKTIQTVFVDSSLALQTQPIWKDYTTKWCKGRIRLNGSSGQMIYYHCMIEHSIFRLKQLNIYYCDGNGCPLTK